MRKPSFAVAAVTLIAIISAWSARPASGNVDVGPAPASANVSPTQEPVINRGSPMTLTGEVVDVSCYKQKGVVEGTGAAHVACAKACVLDKGTALGILSDGDGLFRLWGPMTRDKYAKLAPYLGQTVVITGSEVMLSNNYDVRSFEVQTIKPAKKM